MPEALRRLHPSPRGAGTTLDQFRLNALVSQLAFGGRRRRVYRRITALSGSASFRSVSFRSVVIDNFDLLRVAVPPPEAHAELVVDAYAVLARAIA